MHFIFVTKAFHQKRLNWHLESYEQILVNLLTNHTQMYLTLRVFIACMYIRWSFQAMFVEIYKNKRTWLLPHQCIILYSRINYIHITSVGDFVSNFCASVWNCDLSSDTKFVSLVQWSILKVSVRKRCFAVSLNLCTPIGKVITIQYLSFMELA